MEARLWEKGKREGKKGRGVGHVVGARSASAECKRGEQGGECSGFATPYKCF